MTYLDNQQVLYNMRFMYITSVCHLPFSHYDIFLSSLIPKKLFVVI